MTARRELVATRGPLTRPWQVSAPEDGLPLILLGWRVDPSLEREGGVPESVVSLLTRALSRVGALTYPASNAPAAERCLVRQVNAPSLGDRVRELGSHVPNQIWLVSTTDPTISRELFDDPGFPWSLQGQIVLLSAADAAPNLDRESLLTLMEPTHSLDMRQLAAASLLAVVRPGVDGDVAALISLNANIEAKIVDSLKAEATASDFAWALLSESSFADALTSGKERTPQN